MTSFNDPFGLNPLDPLPPAQPDRPQRPNRGFRRPLLPLLIVLPAAWAIVCQGQRTRTGADADAQPRTPAPRGDLFPAEQATVDLFERTSKSVVYVSPLIPHVRRTLLGFSDYLESGTGSGFIWDKSGHIVTNFHVIQDASRCLVTLADGQTYEAGLVGYWPDKDIAVLSIDAPAEKLVPIQVGTSSDLRVGQSVYAIGNPWGLDFTLTTGVVSALNREIKSVSGRTIQGVIQTDAAINPGNSGGPLLDSAGRLIGMNTAIYSRSGGSAGIGFAVPVDTVNSVASQLIAYGRVIRPGLGINILDDRTAQRFGIEGVLVINVAKGSAAEKAGIRPTYAAANGQRILGDIIIKVDDTPTPNSDALLGALERHKIGDTAKITVLRDGKELTLSVVLQAIQ